MQTSPENEKRNTLMTATETESVVDTTPESDNAAEETATFDVSNFDDTDELLYRKTQATIKSYNDHVNERKALSGDLSEVTDSVRESDLPEIVSLREAVEKAQNTLEQRQSKLDETAKEIAEKRIAENTDTEKVAELDALIVKEAKRIKNTINALVADYGDEVKTAFTSLVTAKSTGSGAGRGLGVARPRNFTVSVNGKVAQQKNNNGELVSSFSAAAKEIGCSTQAVQQPYFDSEGTKPEGWVAGKAVTYSVTHDGKSYSIVAMKNKDK
jgi:uncharacterized protein YueI